jgi:hypothetical protein
MQRSDVDNELWDIRNILHRAVQMHIANDAPGAAAATKEAYQRLSTLLDRAQSNLKPSGTTPGDRS